MRRRRRRASRAAAACLLLQSGGSPAGRQSAARSLAVAATKREVCWQTAIVALNGNDDDDDNRRPNDRSIEAPKERRARCTQKANQIAHLRLVSSSRRLIVRSAASKILSCGVAAIVVVVDAERLSAATLATSRRSVARQTPINFEHRRSRGAKSARFYRRASRPIEAVAAATAVATMLKARMMNREATRRV